MGIKKLYNFLEKFDVQPVIRNLSCFKGKTFAIDTQGIIYLSMHSAILSSKIQKEFKISGGDRGILIDEVVKNLEDLNKKLESFEIKSIFVFDGESPVEKKETQDERKESSIKSKERAELNGTINNGFEPGEVSKIIKQLKVETMIDPKLEGEKLCVKLCKEGKADFVYSKDSDCFAYGANLLIRKISRDNVECYALSSILRVLKLDFEQFLCLCIFSGCDYNENVPGVAISKMYKIIKEVGSDLDKIKGGIYTLKKGKLTEEEFAAVRFERCKQLFTIEI